MSQPATVPKRIVICCDGTWQSSVSGEANIPSNITRLCRSIARSGNDAQGKTWQQVVYYDSGVGTGSLTGVEKKRQGAVGDGLSVNVIEAYNFIVLNYSPGDEIFCFGFSRGAYTARAVAGLVADIGIMEPSQMQIFPEVYDIYKKNVPKKVDGKKEYVQMPFRESQDWKDFVDGKKSTTPESLKLQQELKKHFRKTTDEENRIIWEIPAHGRLSVNDESHNVKVVGVWDTVGALGVPDGRWINNGGLRTEYGFHNVRLNANIEHAFQALALDERRKAFAPAVWYIPNDRPATAKVPNLLQVWFPGVHINIGGGSADTAKGKGDAEQMANITFAWMVECVRPYLAFNETTIHQSMTEYTKLLETIYCKNNHYHDPSKQPNILKRAANGIYKSIPFIGSSSPPAPPVAGWGTGNFVDSFQGAMALPGEKLRTPGDCDTEIVVENDSYLTGLLYPETMKTKKLKELGVTNERVHPVARFRRDQMGLDTGGLKGWKHRPAGEGKGFEWYKDHLVLQEYVIKKENIPGAGNFPNVERMFAAVVEKASQFLKETDVGNGIPADD